MIQRAAGYKQISEKTAAKEIRYGLISSFMGTSFSILVVSQGPPNQKVGMASISEVSVAMDTPLSEAWFAVLRSNRNTVPVMTPMRRPIVNPAITLPPNLIVNLAAVNSSPARRFTKTGQPAQSISYAGRRGSLGPFIAAAQNAPTKLPIKS
jgi:hypothetical protein